MMSRQRLFPTTRWTLVLSAGEEDTRREALDWLCERYWYPIYAYIRRRGHSPTAAQDLTQSFLANLIERRSIEAADPSRGRFRSYLIGALKHHLSDRMAQENATVRGGGYAFQPLSFEEGEERYLRCPQNLSPESLYERQWAFSLLDRVLDLIRAEHAQADKAEVFETLKPFLVGDSDYRQAATALGIPEGTVRVTVHRLRRRYRELITAEIAETVHSEEDVRHEIRYLIEIAST